MYASSSVDRMLAPSVETITAACDALKDAAEDVGAAGRSILETCRKVSDVMKALGLDGPSHGSSFGAVSIAMRAAVTTASKYVDTKTGVSLRQWAEFVSTAQTRFEDYLGQLGKVADIAKRHEASGGALDPDELRLDKRIIEDAQFQTKLWRPIMNRLPQLSHFVEAMLTSKKEKTPITELADGKAGWRSTVNEIVNKVKGRVADEHAELLRAVLGPVSDLRHRITTLHRDVDKMSECMFEFEDLLELQRAQIQMLLGEIDNRQTEILAQRISVAILVPRLKKRVAESRRARRRMSELSPEAGGGASERRPQREGLLGPGRRIQSWSRIGDGVGPLLGRRGRGLASSRAPRAGSQSELAARGAGGGNGARDGRADSR